MRLHGGLGLSWELPFLNWVTAGHIMGIADGPSEVHKVTIARQVLAKYTGSTEDQDILGNPIQALG